MYKLLNNVSVYTATETDAAIETVNTALSSRVTAIEGGTIDSLTIGDTQHPVYLSSGVITAVSDYMVSAATSNVGDEQHPVYVVDGVATAITNYVATAESLTVGSTTQPVYLNNGVITAISSAIVSAASENVGSNVIPVYLSDNTLVASDATVGDSATPVYISNGTITACEDVPTKDDVSNMVPIGTILRWYAVNDENFATNVPGDFLATNGGTYDTTTYSELYTLLGTDTLPVEYYSMIKAKSSL